MAFATTRWSIVLTAQGESPAAQEALEKLCRIYWWPLYGFVRRHKYAPEEAQDLTQGFFAMHCAGNPGLRLCMTGLGWCAGTGKSYRAQNTIFSRYLVPDFAQYS